MKKITTTACIALMSILTTQLFSQSEEEMKKWTEYMTPGDMHKMLEKANGTWNEAITFWQAPGAPPMQMSATCENKMVFNGLYQLSTTKGTFNNMPFEGHSMVAYDNAKKLFQTTWIDNMGSGILFMEGPMDPSTKTVTFKGKTIDPMTGKEILMRETWQIIDDNNQVATMYQTANGQEFKSMEIKLTRKM